MSKNKLIIALGIIPLLLIIILVVAVMMQPKPEEAINEQVSPTPTFTQTTPNPEFTIEHFFQLLDTHEYEQALNLLSPAMIQEEDQAYLESYQTWEKVNIISLTKAAPLDENEEPTFMVEFDLELKPDSTELIWQNGEQTRFFTLSLEAGEYKIIEIATGP
jgi:hypothetical protein